jgi:hypothetical protein
LEWKGPINHPGGIRYRIYVKKESETFRQHNDISGASSKAILDGLEPNVKYEVCVAVVDNHYKTASSSCDDVAVVTTPAQLGKYTFMSYTVIVLWKEIYRGKNFN